MKLKYPAFILLPALAVADNATTVPDDEPWHPPLPEALLSPQKGQEGLPATAQPVVSYKAPRNEEQTWLRLMYVKDTETWPEIFRRMASASHEKNMEMCHGYALWLKGQEVLHLRYDDDLSLSGIHADGHVYGVLFVEFNPYGIRVCPMEGYDLTGKNGGVCWQNAPTQLWSWADAEKFWAELPKLLKADTKKTATSAQDTAVKRDVATKGQRMVVFWAPPGYPAKTWWPSFARLHAAVGPQRFSLIAAEGLNLRADVVVPTVKPATKAGAATPAPTVAPPPAAPATAAAATPPPSAPTPITAAPPLHAVTGKAPMTEPAATPQPSAATTTAPTAAPAVAAPTTTATAAPAAATAAATATAPAATPSAGTSSAATAPTAAQAAAANTTTPNTAAPATGRRRASTTTAAPAATPPAATTSAATPPAATPPTTTTASPAPNATAASAPTETPAEPEPARTGATLDSLPSFR